MKEPEIRVGLITSGNPSYGIDKTDGRIRIENLLIGERFHWQQTVSALLSGRVLPIPESQGNIGIINILPLEEYLFSVVGSEMNPDAPLEFLKAHAVISRSWALRKILYKTSITDSGKTFSSEEVINWEESDSHNGFDVCSDDHCQRYQGLPEIVSSKLSEALVSTRGLVLMDPEGKIADTRFSKCCGGRTEVFSTCWSDSDYPYLISKSDSWCDLSDMDGEKRNTFLKSVLKDYDSITTDFHDWTFEIDKKKLTAGLKENGLKDIGLVKRLSVSETGQSGRIKKLRIEGDKGVVTIGKELLIRRLLSEKCLYSSWFDVVDNGDSIILNGHGWGHGVGLCQIGAARMAYDGKSFMEILNFYYEGAKILKLYD